MDSFEWNKIIGAVLGTAIFIFVVRVVAENIYEPEKPEKPGYVVEGVTETPAGGGAGAPVAPTQPPWGPGRAQAHGAPGPATAPHGEACHDTSAAKAIKIGPPLFGVVDRARASIAGFSYSGAMKGKPGNWTYDELFKFIKSPGADIPGTKMSFAGISKIDDRINLIAYLRSNADAPAPIPAPKPAAAPAAAAPAAGAAPAAAEGAPVKGPNGPATPPAPKAN